MARKSLLLFNALILFTAFEFHEVEAIKCWRCSSEASTFCGEPFDESLIPEAQRRWVYVDCSFSSVGQVQNENLTARPVCKKIKQLINDKVIFSRSCAYEDINLAPDSCMKSLTPSYVKTEFCETCGYDGCNI